MICDECGNQYFNEAKYCPNCGTLISNESSIRGHEFSTPLMIARPVFVPLKIFLYALPLHLFLTVWSAGFFGGVFWGIAIGLDKYIPIDLAFYLPFGSTFLYSGILTFFLYPILMFFFKKKNYAETEYKIFKDSIETTQGIKASKKRLLHYKHINEALLQRNFIQKKHGLGTIVLTISDAGSMSIKKTVGTGIRISDIPNSEKVYNQILDLKK